MYFSLSQIRFFFILIFSCCMIINTYFQSMIVCFIPWYFYNFAQPFPWYWWSDNASTLLQGYCCGKLDWSFYYYLILSVVSLKLYIMLTLFLIQVKMTMKFLRIPIGMLLPTLCNIVHAIPGNGPSLDTSSLSWYLFDFTQHMHNPIRVSTRLS
jgi:hypothetical protein